MSVRISYFIFQFSKWNVKSTNQKSESLNRICYLSYSSDIEKKPFCVYSLAAGCVVVISRVISELILRIELCLSHIQPRAPYDFITRTIYCP